MSLYVHTYHLLSQCKANEKIPLDYNKICRFCFQDQDTMTPVKIYTRQKLFIIETYIADFCTSLYISEIQKIEFHLIQVRILDTNHCGNMCQESFKRCSANQDVLCCCDYDEIVVSIFHTKYSLNNMVEINLCIFKALDWSSLVHQHIEGKKKYFKHTH